MENLRRRVDVRLITEEKSLKKMLTKPQFHAFRIFHDKLSAVNLKKTQLILNRPLNVGFAVLELSKLLMYRFHYDHTLPTYGQGEKLLFTDTGICGIILSS